MASPAVLRQAHAPLIRQSTHSCRPRVSRAFRFGQSRTFRHSPRRLDDVVQARPPPPAARRSLRTYIFATVCLVLGLGGGQFVRAVVVPPPLPLPDTEDDELTKGRIRKDMDALPIVQELRTRRDEWLEYEAYMAQSPEERASSMTAGAMAGSRGVGLQRVFWHRQERRLISVIFIGGAISGWPGVTHGGAVASILLENLERVASGPEVLPESTNHMLDHFYINYKKPTTANMMYIVRAELDDSQAEQTMQSKAKASIENALSGLVTAEATGAWSAGVVQRAKDEVVSTGQTISRWLGW